LDNILSLLEAKETLLLDYERVSGAMLAGTIDSLLGSLSERDAIASEIDEVNAEILTEILDSENPDRVRALLKTQRFEDMTEGETAVYDLSMQISAVWAKLQRLNADIVQFIRAEQERVLEDIKALNSDTRGTAISGYSELANQGANYKMPDNTRKI